MSRQRPGEEHRDYRLVTRLRILEAVKAKGPASKSMVMRHARISSNIVAEPLRELIDKGHFKEALMYRENRILSITPEGSELVDLWGRVKHLLEVGSNGRHHN